MMEEEITLRDVANYLDKVGIQFMATIGLDGKPKVRPMQYMVLEDDKLWFCTNSKKEVYAELQANPCLELCGCKLEPDELQTPWIRFSAEAARHPRRDHREERYRECALQKYARQPDFQGVLSEAHRRMDDQFGQRQRLGKKGRIR